MFNSLELYQECGRRVAIACNENDQARADFETNFFHRMRVMESAENRTIATETFHAAFRAARKLRRGVI